MKLLLFFGVLMLAGWGLVNGVQQLLSVDDLAACPSGPSLLDPACAPADAIVAISGGDTAARTAEAVDLYKKGWSTQLVFSGAAQDRSGPSNAEAMRKQALLAGVPEAAILTEGDSLDTSENALRTSALVASADRIIVVTSQYHQRRAGLEFQHFFGKRVAIVNHPTSHDRLWPQYWWTSTQGWSLALSESIKTLFVMWIPR